MGRFQRLVGVIILGVALGASALLWIAVSSTGPGASNPPEEGVLFGIWNVFYDNRHRRRAS